MANIFVYRSDPPAALAGTIADIAAMQAEWELEAASLGRIGAPAALKADATALRLATTQPLKVSIPSGLGAAATADIDALTEIGARIVEIDGRKLSPRTETARHDGTLLASLNRPRGTVTAVHLGPLSRWSEEGLAALAADLRADRYGFDVADGDTFEALAGLPGESIAVLGLITRTGTQDNEAILSRIDEAAEAIDSDRLALTIAGNAPAGDLAEQSKALRRLADVSIMFWGFAV
jgi:hypothetical protein